MESEAPTMTLPRRLVPFWYEPARRRHGARAGRTV